MVCQSDKGMTTITKGAIRWATEELTDHYAYCHPNSLRHTCMDCGHKWTISDAEKKGNTLVCPHCGRKLEVRETREHTLRQSTYFTILTTRKGMQVLRVALLKTEHRKGEPSVCTCREICRYYMDGQGRCEVIGLKRTMGPYLDTFSYNEGMELRHDNEAFSHLSTFPTYPKMKVIPELERNGFNGNFYGVEPLKMFKAILCDNRYETILKSGHTDHFRYFIKYSNELDICWYSYKIALRNHYDISNISMWCDTICMLRKTGKDIRNAHYVCPTDLQAIHDRLVQKIEEKAERERRAEEMKRAAEDEAEFRAMKERYFGLIFSDGLINVRVLESVEEHRQEGSHMHHCVFSARYYSNENSLIFSATINGERVETVECDLRQLRVVQSRGVCNKNTEYHDRIVSLVNSNADSIRQRITA
jgi:DNA-directed RNA polymerase subunit RPC12/RpoP